MITVASVPSSHVYVRHLEPVVADSAVHRLPDPVPETVDIPGQWWPPRFLDPDWLGAQLSDAKDRFDLLHVHFGFESFAVDQLVHTVEVLRASGTPLVVTVHDLHNPHSADNAEHLARLDVLIPAADAVITLTAGAAAHIRARWGVSATVIEHPHVVPLERMERSRPTPDAFVIGVHAKSLRANLDPLAVLDAAVEAARALPNAMVRLDIDDDVFDHSSPRYAPTTGAKLLDYAGFPDVDVRVHRRFDDDELWDYLASIDVAVLPYRFGTHSGWLEACRDLGTAVVAPTCGYYADQAEVHQYDMDQSSFDASSLVAAVIASYEVDTAQLTTTARSAQRDRIAAAHLEVYTSVLTGSAGAPQSEEVRLP